MDDSRRSAVNFLEKEIKTYAALSLFLTKRALKGPGRIRAKKSPISPSFYRDRMKEAKKLVYELRKPN
jgi:hypothetical protein